MSQNRRNFLDYLESNTVIFDGAIGSLLYEKGFFVNNCYESLNINNSEAVKSIHKQYIATGVDVIETNTFSANAINLRQHGLLEQHDAINRAGVQVAKAAVEESERNCFVAGSVGSILKIDQLWQAKNADKLYDTFKQQLAVIIDEGVDLIILETFYHIEELQFAAAIVKEIDPNMPVIGSFVIKDSTQTLLLRSLPSIIKTLNNDSNIDIVGINCNVGPTVICECAENIKPLLKKPLLAMPNSGSPKNVDGRTIYMSTPEFFATYAKRYVELGVELIGGCCGIHPEHLKEAVSSIRSTRRTSTVESIDIDSLTPDFELVPVEEKSAFARKIANGEKVKSIEIVPPRSYYLDDILSKAQQCKENGIDAINIPDGPRASSRISPMITAIEIERQMQIETVLHYCCRDRNLIGMQSDLLGAYAVGLRNILIITGDSPKLGEYPDATGVFDTDSVGLTSIINKLNHGLDFGLNPIPKPTSFFTGVGANPCAMSMEKEIEHFANKVTAGAEFAITQPIFDPVELFKFLDLLEKHDCQIPIVAGVWPLVSYRNAVFMKNEVPGVEIPDHIIDKMSYAKTKEDGLKIGLKIAQDIIKQIEPRVSGIQMSAPFGKVDLAIDALN